MKVGSLRGIDCLNVFNRVNECFWLKNFSINLILLLLWRDRTNELRLFQLREQWDHITHYHSYLIITLSDRIPVRTKTPSNHPLYCVELSRLGGRTFSTYRVLANVSPQTLPVTVVIVSEWELLLSFYYFEL